MRFRPPAVCWGSGDWSIGVHPLSPCPAVVLTGGPPQGPSTPSASCSLLAAGFWSQAVDGRLHSFEARTLARLASVRL